MTEEAHPPSEKSRSSRRRPRRSRRSSGHDAASEAAARDGAANIPDHPLVPTAAPELIETDAALAEFIEHVREAGTFAYDTEFIGEESYYPRFCVIQIGTSEQIALVDPLAGVDVSPVWEIIADPELETIVHAGSQDLEPVVRHLDRGPANVIDTQVAAAFVNQPYPLGLRDLVGMFVGARLGKKLTFTDWAKRPLSQVHQRYAADDVRYLLAAKEALEALLEESGHAAWVTAECRELCDPARYRFDAHSRYVRLLGARDLRLRCRRVLYELVCMRDELARAVDQPPQTFLRDDVLLRLARDPVRDASRLAMIKGFPRPVAHNHGETILEAIQRGLDEPEGGGAAPALPRESPRDRVAIDGLWAATTAYCRGRRIDPVIVTSRREIAQLHFSRSEKDVERPSSIGSGWRHELLGDLLDGVAAGRGEVRISWDDGELRSVLDAEDRQDV